METATQKQKDYMTKLGVTYTATTTKREAMDLISKAKLDRGEQPIQRTYADDIRDLNARITKLEDLVSRLSAPSDLDEPVFTADDIPF